MSASANHLLSSAGANHLLSRTTQRLNKHGTLSQVKKEQVHHLVRMAVNVALTLAIVKHGLSDIATFELVLHPQLSAM